MEHLIDSQEMDADFQTYSFAMTEKEERWGYVQEDLAFIDAILKEKSPLVTAKDGFKSVELVESVYNAVKSGKHIKFG